MSVCRHAGMPPSIQRTSNDKLVADNPVHAACSEGGNQGTERPPRVVACALTCLHRRELQLLWRSRYLCDGGHECKRSSCRWRRVRWNALRSDRAAVRTTVNRQRTNDGARE
jgi:hypothetical protein